MQTEYNRLSYYSLFSFLGTMIPFICVFFLTMFSIVNRQLLNVIVYLFGIFITSGIIVLLAMVFRLEKLNNANPLCDLLTFPFMSKSISTRYPNPHLNTGILAYSIGYTLLGPCIDNIKNPPIIALVLFLLLHFIYLKLEYQYKCSTLLGLFTGTMLGITIGCIYYLIIKINNSELLYNREKIDNCGYIKNPNMICNYVQQNDDGNYKDIDIDEAQLESIIKK